MLYHAYEWSIATKKYTMHGQQAMNIEGTTYRVCCDNSTPVTLHQTPYWRGSSECLCY